MISENKIKSQSVLTNIKLIKTKVRSQLVEVNDVLDAFTLLSGNLKTKLSLFNILDHLTQITDIANCLVKGSQVEIRQKLNIDPKLQLWGDCQRIEQVIIGLVQFCMVFTQRGAITITADFNEKEQRIKFEIKDTGVGMDDLELKQLMAGETNNFILK